MLYNRVCLVFATAILISCSGGDGAPPPDTTAPVITSTTPDAGEVDVNTTQSLSVVFSETMASSSFTSNTFRLEGTGGAVPGSINVNGAVATFTPQQFLDPSSTYTLIVTTGITDVAGNTLQTDNNVNFTTRSLTTVNVTWNANHETAVNTSGGGYKLYYSTTPGFNLNDAGVVEVDVPNVAGPTPTSASVDLHSTRYYFRVVAYSSLTSPWGVSGSVSEPSAENSFAVP